MLKGVFLAILSTFCETLGESGNDRLGECSFRNFHGNHHVGDHAGNDFFSGNNTCKDDLEEEKEAISEASCTSITSPAPEKATSEHGEDMGVPQLLDDRNQQAQAILDRILEARQYMQNEVSVDEKYNNVRTMCKNNHESCTLWSLIGECESNPGWMKINCGPVCHSCEMLHVDTRCPLDPNAVDAWQPGDLNKMFERVAYEPEYKQYQPVVVSKPPEGPWMIMLENAISDGEAEKMIQLGGQLGYERSADVGKRKEDGTYTDKVNSGRTSTNAWCMKDCTEDPVAQRVMERIENITGIPETNSENLQLLRYEHEQFYQTHSDYIPYQADRPTGVRILTFYMYLNDVEEGGGTNFPHLKNLTVTPKRGRAVMWPSVHNDRPNKKDRRTEHQALPVIRGVKYGANAWVHQRDYKNPNRNGC